MLTSGLLEADKRPPYWCRCWGSSQILRFDDRQGVRQTGEVFQCFDARHEEIRTSPHSHELRQRPQALADRRALRGEAVGGAHLIQLTLSHNRIVVRVEAAELGIVDPGLLHELELPGDAGVEAEEE